MNNRWRLIWKLSIILLAFLNLSDSGWSGDPSSPYNCFPKGGYTADSTTYRTNLYTALDGLASNTTKFGFYSTSIGQGQDTANVVAICFADTEILECNSCVKNATADLRQSCTNQTEVFRWYWNGLCTLRYSNRTLTGLATDNRGYATITTNQPPVENPTQFRQILMQLLDVLRPVAANSLLKVSTGNRKLGLRRSATVISALLQCVPTLSLDECNRCLSRASVFASKFFNLSLSQGGRLVLISCYIRYETYSFVRPTRLQELNINYAQVTGTQPPATSIENSSPPAANVPNPRTEMKSDNSVIKIVVPIPIVVGIILVACAAIFLKRRQRKKLTNKRLLQPIQKNNGEDISSVDSLQYEFHQIRVATDDFSDANKLGRGGFGAVYRGELSNGHEIAVKRLSRESGQGDTEFKNEVLLVAKLQHRNLVRLLGFASEGSERLLIYEFVPNSSLDHFIFDTVKSKHLNWETRSKIIGGIARGLLYLHEDSRLRIIHRDLKASNVLLDEEMNPKIADFGMARLFKPNEIQGNTSKIVGTYGYMSPEYAIYGQFSVKSDVFSFGVLILEIISGQKIISTNGEGVPQDLLTIVWENWCEGTIESVVDPVIRAERNLAQDVLRIIHIGLLCVQENPNDRPAMGLVVLMLSSSTLKLVVPSQPAFLLLSRFGPNNIPTFTSSRCSEFNQIHDASSQNATMITELHPR